MVQAFKDHLTAEACLCITFEGSPYHSNRFLYPIVNALQRYCGWQSDERPEAKLLKLEATLSAAGFDPKQTVPLLTSLLSLPWPARYPALNLSSEDSKPQPLWTSAAATNISSPKIVRLGKPPQSIKASRR